MYNNENAMHDNYYCIHYIYVYIYIIFIYNIYKYI